MPIFVIPAAAIAFGYAWKRWGKEGDDVSCEYDGDEDNDKNKDTVDGTPRRSDQTVTTSTEDVARQRRHEDGRITIQEDEDDLVIVHRKKLDADEIDEGRHSKDVVPNDPFAITVNPKSLTFEVLGNRGSRAIPFPKISYK